MRIPRLSFPDSLPRPSTSDLVPLDSAQSRHGLKSLRLEPGRAVELTGPWGLAPAVVEGTKEIEGRKILLVRLTGPFEGFVPLIDPTLGDPALGGLSFTGPTLGLALVKGPRFDWAVEKAAELGAAKLVPLLTERTASSSLTGQSKQSRWIRLAEEARKQCGRPSPMIVSEPMSLLYFIASDPPSPKLLLDPDGEPFPAGQGGPGTFLIGPEGGFAKTEKSAILAAGFVSATLGGLRLKTETAALAALARWIKS